MRSTLYFINEAQERRCFLQLPDKRDTVLIKRNDTIDRKKITSNHLMHLASNKFKALIEAGKWNVPSKEEYKSSLLKRNWKNGSIRERTKVKAYMAA